MLAEDIVRIQQLICREREARDRAWWDEMRATWAEDSHVNVSWYSGPGKGFIDGSVRLQETSTPVKHKLGPIMVRIKGDKAVASVSTTILTRTVVEGIQADLGSDTRLIYRAVKQGGGWLLSSLDCIYESDRLTAATPGEQVVIDPETLNRYRQSYRCLSFVLEMGGVSVNKDLPGDDKPDQVRQLYSSIFAWAGLFVS